MLRCPGLVILLTALSHAALAAPIGNAVAVTPNASAEGSRGAVQLARGSAIEPYDRVRTSPGGATTLRFLDSSQLAIGPGALVTIDEFVYSGPGRASSASLTMARGAFRWVSGRSPKDAYDLKTPLATIGVRGTSIAVLSEPQVTSVRLSSGAITACSRISGQCASLGRSGQGVRLWADGRVEVFGPGTGGPPQRRAAAPPPDLPPPGQPPIDPGAFFGGLSIGIGGFGGGRGPGFPGGGGKGGFPRLPTNLR